MSSDESQSCNYLYSDQTSSQSVNGSSSESSNESEYSQNESAEEEVQKSKRYEELVMRVKELEAQLPQKDFRCPEPGCPKSFTKSAGLSRHVSAHYRELYKIPKPHQCVCGSAFHRKDHYLTHQISCKVKSGK